MSELMNKYTNYMAYPSKLFFNISSKMDKLRESTVNSNRILFLSRYVKQLKNKNSAFSFTRDVYKFIVNPINYTSTSNLVQFFQNSSFLVSHLQDNPELLSFIVFSTRKQWQFIYLVNCIIPSLFGYFSCHEYVESSILFYAKIINDFPPNLCIQIIQPFFHSGLTYHFFDNSYGKFINSILVDKNILKNPDMFVSVFTDLLIENIRESINCLPIEFFELLDLIKKKRWNFEDVKCLIVDSFLLPELKIWSSKLDINIELKNFVYRIIDLISISMSQQNNGNIELNSSPRSSSMYLISSLYLTDFSGSTNLSSLCLNLDHEIQPIHKVNVSRSYSILNPSRSQQISEESRHVIANMNSLIDSFFIEPDQIKPIYQMTILFENYPEEIFSQFTQLTLSVFDILFVAKTLLKEGRFPPNVSRSIFNDDLAKPFFDGVFYCHVFSPNLKIRVFQPFFSLFKNNERVQSSNKIDCSKTGLNISFLENESYVRFLKLNKKYAEIFDSFIIRSRENSKCEQMKSIEKGINYLTWINEIKKQNDKLHYHSSFLLEPYINQIVDGVKNQSNILKNISFIELFQKLIIQFNLTHLTQMKKILYLKLLDLFYNDLLGDYWNVLMEFNNFWMEFVNDHENRKKFVSKIKTKFSFFSNSIELISKIDKQPLCVKYFEMIWAFSMLEHVSKHVQEENLVYEVFFKKIRSKEFMLSFLIIDFFEMNVEVFKKLCTNEEINCWNCMKKNIEIYLKQNRHYYQVYLSINDYLFEISPRNLYNTLE